MIVVGAGGVTIQVPTGQGSFLSNIYSVATCVKIATDTWTWYGPAGTGYTGSLGSFAVGPTAISSMAELVNVIASAPSTTSTFDIINQSILYYTTNATVNFTLNVRGSASVTFTSLVGVGQSVSLALMVTNGTTPFYPNVFQIDGAAQSVKWIGGTPITAGNASGIDVYTFNIIKTAATPTYTVLGVQNKFA